MPDQVVVNQLASHYSENPKSLVFARYADALLLEEKVEEATNICQQGVQDYPGYLSGYLVLGRCLLISGNLDGAREQFEKALALDKRCISALKSLGDILVSQNNDGLAAEKYDAILKIDPFNPRIRELYKTNADGEDDNTSAFEGVISEGEPAVQEFSPEAAEIPEEPSVESAVEEEGTESVVELESEEEAVAETLEKPELAEEETVLEEPETSLTGDDIASAFDEAALEDETTESESVALEPIEETSTAEAPASEEAAALDTEEVPEEPAMEELETSLTGDDIASAFDEARKPKLQRSPVQEKRKRIQWMMKIRQ
jgi:tetratricopeptide (TPR) repeat protein